MGARVTDRPLDIGNARVAGMYNDLHLSSAQFEWLLRVFYITYIAFEWMTLLWKVFPPHIYRKLMILQDT